MSKPEICGLLRSGFLLLKVRGVVFGVLEISGLGVVALHEIAGNCRLKLLGSAWGWGKPYARDCKFGSEKTILGVKFAVFAVGFAVLIYYQHSQ